MTQRARPNPRPISAREAAVVRATLLNAQVKQYAPGLLDTVGSLIVEHRCECGCDTVAFQCKDPAGIGELVGEGEGRTPEGAAVCVMVFATEAEITCLEVYASDGEAPARLPDPATVRPGTGPVGSQAE